MKKLLSLLLAVLFVTGAAAQIDISDSVRTQAEDQPSAQMCIRYLNGQYPDADVQGIRALCERMHKNQRLTTQTMPVMDQMGPEARARLARLSDEDLQRLQELDEEDLRKVQMMDRARLRQVLASHDVPSELSRYRVNTYAQKEDMFRARSVENYQQARQRYQHLKENYGELKGELAQNRARFQNAVEAGNDEQALEAGRQYLLTVADIVINTLEQVQSKVEENDDMTEQEAAEILSDLDEKIQSIEEAKTQVQQAQTKEEMKEAGQQVIQAWARMKNTVRMHTANVYKTKINDVLKRSTFMELQLERALSYMQEKEYDTSTIDEDVTEFSVLVEGARDQFLDAQQLLAESRTGNLTKEETQHNVAEARVLINEAHNTLRDAHEVLKGILRDIKEMTGSLDAVTEESQDYVLIEECDQDCSAS